MFSTGNTRMVWLPDAEKNLKMSLFVSTEYMNITDIPMDGWTDTARGHKPREASCSKNGA